MPTEPTPIVATSAADVRPQTPSEAAPPRIGRTGMLFGLTGIFSFVLGSLILTRPEPLRAHAIDPAIAAATAQLDAVLGPATAPSSAATAGNWTALIIQHSTADESVPASRVAHITVALDSPTGPTVSVARIGDADGSAAGTRRQPMVVAVTGNPADDTMDWRDDPTVRLLVSRLCDRLKIDDRHVRWS